MHLLLHFGKYKFDYDFYWITKRKLNSTIVYSLGMTLAGIIVLTAIGILSSNISMPSRVDWGWVIYYVLVSVPLQEIIFRGIIFTELAKRTDLHLAMVLASAVYAAAYVTQVNLIIFAFFAGLMWNYMMYEKPNIIGPIISHVILGLYLFLFLV